MNTLSVTRLQKNTTLRGDAHTHTRTHTHTHQNVKILILKKYSQKSTLARLIISSAIRLRVV